MIDLNWLICVVGSARGNEWIGPLVVFLWILIHLYFIGNKWESELLVILGAGVMGFLVDTLLGLSGAMRFYRYSLSGVTSPPFMVALWLSFATSLAFSLRWLQRRYFLGGVLGLVAGPLAYYAGMKLGAVQFNDNIIMAMVFIGIAWFASMPALLRYREWVYTKVASCSNAVSGAVGNRIGDHFETN